MFRQEDWEFTMKVNLTGTMLVSRELIPLLERASGNVCNVASNVARRGLPYRADYVCSKWAIIGLTQVMTSSSHHLVW